MTERQTPRCKPTHAQLKRPPAPKPQKREPPAMSSTQSTEIVHVQTQEAGDGWRTVKYLHECKPAGSIVNPAHISVGGAVTMKIREYESAKVNVQITWPCKADSEQAEALYIRLSQWVDQKIKMELESV